MKSAPVETTLKVGNLGLAIRRYADGRYGFDMGTGELRKKIRCESLKDAETKGRTLLGAAEVGRINRMEINEDDFIEFLRWKSARQVVSPIPKLVQRFLKSRESIGLSRATMRELESTLLPFSKRFDCSIATLSLSDVEDWLNARGVGPRRWNNMRAAIIALHRFARIEGCLPAELMPVERMVRRKVRVTVETYSPAELRAFLRVVPKEWRPLIVLGAFCGLRPEEIAPDRSNGKPGLRWENILWEKSKIDVPEEISKVRRRRFAHLSDAAKAWLPRDRKGPVVPQTLFQNIKRTWAKDAGTVWKRNGWRHSYASYRLAITEDAAALSLEMGNSPTMIFRHYLDLKHEDEAVEWFAIRPSKVPKVPSGKALCAR